MFEMSAYGYEEQYVSSTKNEKHTRADDYSEKKRMVSKRETHKKSPDSDDNRHHRVDDQKEEVLRERLREKYRKHKHDNNEDVKRKHDRNKREKDSDIDSSDENSPNIKRKKPSHRKQKYDSRHTHEKDDRYDTDERETKHHRTDESTSYKFERKDKQTDRKPDRSSRHHQNVNRRGHRTNERDWDKGKSGEPWGHERPSSDRQASNEESQTSSKNNIQKEEPNFKLSGKLTEYTNTYNGVVIVYNEPPEARKPKTKWRLYPFKGQEALPMLPLHRQSAFLLGRDRKVADIPIDHPSCSKQHAVLQFRIVDYERPDGRPGRRVKPYVIDLESRNGTFVNNKKVDPRCYVELMEKDVVKFGFSSREYVLLHEKSQDDPPSSGDD